MVGGRTKAAWEDSARHPTYADKRANNVQHHPQVGSTNERTLEKMVVPRGLARCCFSAAMGFRPVTWAPMVKPMKASMARRPGGSGTGGRVEQREQLW